ncbi:hypothetical protein [Planomonospora venezuelensis]|uniref:Uncharacterized protein n=1 Tax=Planomonospora venezuelensis TaxID=1999 RepID=A0A841D858_PLAVE|nr:hypothetical protein [Planomonospora venezuelensis]MBB5964508.1 hypothetical protein [Planomonospora venezuelensis]GIN04243.1 hypothetical protein Pve01_59010 [Planomonospora venezuelensis]
MTGSNSGFQITGGTFNGPMAAGAGAHAVQNIGAGHGGADADRTAELLALVRELVRRHAGELGDTRPVLRDADEVETELRQEEPDREYLSDSLGRMARRVASVAAIAEAVAALTNLIL